MQRVIDIESSDHRSPKPMATDSIARNPIEAEAQRRAALVAVQDAFMDREQRQIARRVAEAFAANNITDAQALLAAAMIISHVSERVRSRSVLRAARLDYVEALASVTRDIANALLGVRDGVPINRIVSELFAMAPLSAENHVTTYPTAAQPAKQSTHQSIWSATMLNNENAPSIAERRR